MDNTERECGLFGYLLAGDNLLHDRWSCWRCGWSGYIIQYASFILRQWFLPFFYVKSGSNLKPNGSFEICSSWGFQNTPYMLNLMEFWLSYMRLKTSDTTSKSNFDSTLLLLWKLSLAFNHEYLSQFLIKFKDQGQFWNLLFTRIPKVSLIFKIDKELTEIFKVKGKAQFLKKQ